jgi:hypothetical protein
MMFGMDFSEIRPIRCEIAAVCYDFKIIYAEGGLDYKTFYVRLQKIFRSTAKKLTHDCNCTFSCVRVSKHLDGKARVFIRML